LGALGHAVHKAVFKKLPKPPMHMLDIPFLGLLGLWINFYDFLSRKLGNLITWFRTALTTTRG
jgi:hypothetical protein